MNSKQKVDHHELLDEDPALDYLLFEEMTKEEGTPPKNRGCLSLALFFLIQAGAFYYSSVIIA